MFAEIAKEINSTPNPPPYTEEKKAKIGSDFREIINKLLDPGYEMTAEDQMKIILHARAFRVTQFLLNQKTKKETVEKKVKIPKAPKEKKEKIKIPTTSEYKKILIGERN